MTKKKKYRDVYEAGDDLLFMIGDWTRKEFVECCRTHDDGFMVKEEDAGGDDDADDRRVRAELEVVRDQLIVKLQAFKEN